MKLNCIVHGFIYCNDVDGIELRWRILKAQWCLMVGVQTDSVRHGMSGPIKVREDADRIYSDVEVKCKTSTSHHKHRPV